MRSSPFGRGAGFVLALAALQLAAIVPSGAQTTQTSRFPIPYTLLKDSRYEEGCFAPCMCPILLQDEVRGGFTLYFVGFDPPFILYDVKDVDWSVPLLGRTFSGSGRYRIGWKGSAQQRLELDLSDNGAPPQRFDSGFVPVTRPFPLIDIAISLHGFFCHDKAFFLKAAPARRVALEVRIDPPNVFWEMFPDSPGYDAVFGRLSVLRQTGGDFTAATAGCLASAVTSSPAGASPDPPIGEAFWYLVRAYGGVAGTTYDSGDPGDGGTCDAQIDAAPDSCP